MKKVDKGLPHVVCIIQDSLLCSVALQFVNTSKNAVLEILAPKHNV